MSPPSVPAGTVVVGTDGSPRGQHAVLWAAAEAARRTATLHVLSTVAPMDTLAAYDLYPPNMPRALDRSVAERAVEEVRKHHPDLAVTSEVRAGRAAHELVKASLGAALVVVGARGHGPLAGKVLGSVSQQVVGHAHCPVVVVRRSAPLDDGPVVVGVDGSPAASTALEFALADAARRGTYLRVLHAQYVETGIGSVAPAGWSSDLTDVLTEEAAAVRTIVEQAATRHPGVDVDLRAVHEHPVEALRRESEDAGLLVVGTRGLGGFSGLLLGSVSHGVLSRARCAVAVVRGT